MLLGKPRPEMVAPEEAVREVLRRENGQYLVMDWVLR